MTIDTVSFRDFTRGYIPADVLMLLDKKTKLSKGLYIKPEYAHEVLELIQQKEQTQKQKRKKALLDFVGAFGENEGRNDTHQDKHLLKQKYPIAICSLDSFAIPH
ncbi:MAG: hypothetical protein KU38_08035 [Sulfurovum sp. FS08-3]|nr:MAG: hypothetical protein KU38_08035 [Sulfurovum sp. FS08-3]